MSNTWRRYEIENTMNNAAEKFSIITVKEQPLDSFLITTKFPVPPAFLIFFAKLSFVKMTHLLKKPKKDLNFKKNFQMSNLPWNSVWLSIDWFIVWRQSHIFYVGSSALHSFHHQPSFLQSSRLRPACPNSAWKKARQQCFKLWLSVCVRLLFVCQV